MHAMRNLATFSVFISFCRDLVTSSERTIVSFEDDLYANLLMRAVSGSLYPFDTRLPHIVDNGFPLQPFDFEKRKFGLDWPIIGHTMIGWVRLQNIYHALQACELENVAGDFVEAGVWRGGASVFAAGIIKHHGYDRDVWLFDSFAGFEANPWDGDSQWAQLNEVVAVPVEEVRATFERYGLLGPRVRFVPGFFADSLPAAAVGRIAVLRMDGDLFSSTSDILYNLYERVAIGGFVIVDDYGIEACRRAVDDFRRRHGIGAAAAAGDWGGVDGGGHGGDGGNSGEGGGGGGGEELVAVDNRSAAVYWRKRRHVKVRAGLYAQMVAVREGRAWEYGGPADRERCHISGECVADSAWSGDRDDSEEGYLHHGAGRDADACLARARAWHAHCRNPSALPVTATFVLTGESRTFPPPPPPPPPDDAGPPD